MLSAGSLDLDVECGVERAGPRSAYTVAVTDS
jgi:hypothetical protein